MKNKIKEFLLAVVFTAAIMASVELAVYLWVSFTYWEWYEMTEDAWILARGAFLGLTALISICLIGCAMDED